MGHYEEPGMLPGRCPETLPAWRVLELHSGLHKTMSRMTPRMRESLIRYGIEDIQAGHGRWAASHLHPATDIRDLSPWLISLGADLFGATTYQVTAEMLELARGLSVTTPDLADIVEEDLPSPGGFMWFDEPIPRPSVEDQPGQEPLLMHAISWTTIPELNISVQIGDTDQMMDTVMPAIRIREWGWNDDPTIAPRPLHLMGQAVVPLTERVHTQLTELHLVHMIWILMGMEIVNTRFTNLDRPTRRRARNLERQSVRVVKLRRSSPSQPTGEHRRVDWQCTWLVRGHHRHIDPYNHGEHGELKHRAAGRGRAQSKCRTCRGRGENVRTTWVHPYIKGPEGQPLSSIDILFVLAR